jgi:hypothetical protein
LESYWKTLQLINVLFLTARDSIQDFKLIFFTRRFNCSIEKRITIKKQIIKCGWGKTDITPTQKTPLKGQFYQRIPTHTNDPLFPFSQYDNLFHFHIQNQIFAIFYLVSLDLSL